MLKKLQTLKSKKGFTLVELIVVLLIIAILAAALIPSMTRYINDAKDKADYSSARAAYIAAQMVATTAYAKGLKGTDIYNSGNGQFINAAGDKYNALDEFKAFAELPTDASYIVILDNNTNKVTSFTYQSATGNPIKLK